MIKKKLNIFLLPLLVVLFISLLGTISYAKELTLNDVKNFCVNYHKFLYGENADTTNLINNLNTTTTENFLQGWVNSAKNSQGRYILSGVNGYILYWIYDGNATNLNKYGPYYNSYNIYVNTSYLTRWRQRYSVYDYSNEGWSAYDTQVGLNNRYFFYTDTNIYTNSTISNGSIKYNAGYMTPSNLFEGPFKDDYFTFLVNSSLNSIEIGGNEVPYLDLQTNQAESFILGQLGLAKNYDYSELFEYRYKYGKWVLNNIRKIDNIGTIINDLVSVTIKGEWVNSNTLYTLTMYSKPDTDFENFSQPFYITNRNTIISNGALDLDNTFSGDYYNNYNNDTNTNDIINNINDASEVIGQLNEFVSGDSEDLAKKLGFQLIGGVDYYNFIQYNIQKIVDILAEDENVYFDYSMHGERPKRIYASDFTTSPSLFKTFGCLFLIACTIFVFYYQMTTFLESLATLQFTSAIDWLTIDRSIFRM